MTRYYVDVARGALADEIRAGTTQPVEGFRFVTLAKVVSDRTERWLVEDDGAPADLEGLLIEPAISLFTHESRAVITDRRVRAER